MEKENEDYKYVGDFGRKTVEWKLSEITWEKFENFVMSQLVTAPICLIWYKESNEDMQKINYVYENTNEDMFELCWAGKTSGELDVFIEHDCSEHIPGVLHYLPNSYREDINVMEEDYNAVSDEDYDVDRPREDEEPHESEKSEDEVEFNDNVAVGLGDNVGDQGDENGLAGNLGAEREDVVLEEVNGATDDRFKTLFEEGTRTRPEKEVKEAHCEDAEEREEEGREAEESDEEYGLGDEEYPDTSLESEEEWEQMSNARRSKGKKVFHGDMEKEPYIWFFQKFNSGLEFKDQLLRYSLNTKHDVKMAKSESNRIAAVCCNANCNWKVYCSFEAPLNRWMVKVCQMEHNHGKSSRVSMMKQGVIAGLFREEIRRNAGLQAAEIKDTIKSRYNIVTPISKCYRARRIALDTILEAQTIQFGKLWDYEAELRRSHNGITTDLCTTQVNGVQMFDSFYICFDELRKSWKSCCRPVIGLDGCFLKWELNGDLLAAVGRDADNRMYPVAWAVVRGENKDTWGWFVKNLKADLNLGSGDNLTIISDKQKGIIYAIEKELPNAEHRMCARHIYSNWKKLGFTRSEYKTLFWGVAYSYTEGEFEDKMKLVQSYDPSAYEALLKTDPKRWCRAFFSTESHCPDVHNNLSESFNRTIKIARSKPVINLLEDIRRQAMRRISRRFCKSQKLNTIVTPITLGLLEKARTAKKYCSTICSSSNLYEVIEFGNGYTVNLATHQCACRRWDLTGIPCKHAVCVLDDNQEDPVKYVAEHYYTHVFKKTYFENIKPVNGENLWKKINKPSIGIPEVRKPRGRPKNRDRIKEPFESLKTPGKATRHGRILHCSRCGQAGHIKSGCKNEPVNVYGPTNRRGRPRKTQAENQPNVIPNPRTRRTNQPIGSNAEPQFISSAPQPSFSSNQPMPHLKKAIRGRPLKIRKAMRVPSGIGTFWSPFTDRSFEVFGDRVYDRSNLNPHPPEHPPE